MNSQQIQQEALSRATGGRTAGNYPAIFAGLMAKGIPEAEITPRVNVFTYDAWRALGRQVRKGEHGVKVATIIRTTRKERDDATGQDVERSSSRPWTTTVFHVSQTDLSENVQRVHAAEVSA